MADDRSKWDYLFISDLHLALGYDPERRAYHAREDFFFDEVFFRWLRWADESCAQGRRWELVMVGDLLDFLPVDDTALEAYFAERERRRRQFDLSDPEQTARYWREQFGAPPEARAPERVQRMLFEDDLLRQWVQLSPVDPEGVTPLTADLTPVPEWALRVYADHHPDAALEGSDWTVQAPGGNRSTAFLAQVTPNMSAPPDPIERPAIDPDFERRYGFIPTPEKSADKATSIYQGHPIFFRALAWFVGRGHRLVFVRGNHDLELYWPQVQDRLRSHIAAEYRAAFDCAPEDPLPPDFQERIDFRPGWFHYRRGVFYAEHGKQYEPLDSCPNPIRPVMPGDPWVLSPPVGSLGVISLHNPLEDAFPEWENRGQHAVVLLELMQRYPLRMLSTVVGHGLDFMRMARRLWMAGRRKDLGPTEADFSAYGALVDLSPETVEAIYQEIDPPLLQRKGLAWLLFSPGGHVVKGLMLLVLAALGLGAALLWYLVLVPALAALIPDQLFFDAAGSALQLLAKVLLWAVPPVAYELGRRELEKRYPELFLKQAMERVHAHLKVADPDLRFYIVGHDHRPDIQIVERRDDGRHVYYLNTGSWTPWFARGERRLQTLGQEVQFTFVQLTQGEDGCRAGLLRWNDDAGRVERQIVPFAAPTLQG
ncbi:MAG: hypothetical protein PVI59_15810 [Anaerolineae bacterium]|jgi:UDP-2,3-diacylglucosamine pyrophosphatase LpxH